MPPGKPNGANPVTPLHLNPQRADVLLGPIIADLNALEWRTERYFVRLKLSESDASIMREANTSLRETLARISNLRDGNPAEASR